jgi:hypothetical protein
MVERKDEGAEKAGLDGEGNSHVLTVARDSGLTVDEVRAKLAAGLSYCGGIWRHYGDESVAYYEDNH